MANTFLTPNIIAKEALVNLYSACFMAQLVHRDFSQEFNQVGDTISVRRPTTFEAKDFSSEITIQDALETSIDVKLDKHKDVSFAITSKQAALELKDFSAQLIAPAMEALAQQIDVDCLGLFKDVNNAYAMSSTPVISDISVLAKMLNNNKVPTANRSLIVNPDAQHKYITLPDVLNAEKSGTTATLREASMGRLFGLNTFMSQNVHDFTKGTLGTAKVKAATAKGSATVVASNTSLTGALKVGDIITIAGDTTQYLVTEAVTAASNEATVKIAPKLQAAADADAAITVFSGGSQNLAFHKNAFALVTRPLELPKGNARAAIAQYNGFGLRVVMDYDITHKKDIVSIDVLYGVKTLDPRLAVRFVG